jgi:hypothetical protein
MDRQVPDQLYDEKDVGKGEKRRELPSNGKTSTGTASASERDKYVVDWEGPDDPNNSTNLVKYQEIEESPIVNSITPITWAHSPGTWCFNTYLTIHI